jgi:hypothetical protein
MGRTMRIGVETYGTSAVSGDRGRRIGEIGTEVIIAADG